MTARRLIGPRGLSLVLVAAAAAGCVGEIGRPDPTGNGGGGGTGSVQQPSCGVGPAPLRRLTNVEYDNTVRDLLGDTSKPASSFPPDENLSGFAAGAAVSPLLAELYMTAGESLAKQAVADLSKLLPCDPAAIGEAECAQAFIVDFGKRAFRRPLTADEVQQYRALYDGERKLEPFAASLELVIASLLQSPEFLYRPEVGGTAAGAKRVALTPHQLASRLSYFLWQTLPDAELFARADDGSLLEPETLAAEARRMLGDPRAKDGVRSFFRQWLHLGELPAAGKSTSLYPSWNAKLASAMSQETQRFVEEVFWAGDGRLSTLLTADWTMGNAELASLYGAQAPSGTGFVKLTLNPSQRAGLLTQAGLLSVLAGAEDSSPILRGIFVREGLLCQPLPSPPEGLDIMPPDPDPNLTTRQRFAQHTADPACRDCHELIDPVGFGFEHYDAIGKYRASENGLPVDASGELTETLDANGKFDGVPELAKRLSQSAEVHACMTKQWFRFALGRAETDADACSLEHATKTFTEADGDLRELIVALVQTEAFRVRPEVQP